MRREGAVQAAVSGLPRREFVALDREVSISYGSKAEAVETQSTARERLRAVLSDADPKPSWWRGGPGRLGDECDVLAVSRTGELLAIEVKDSRDTSAIGWSPAQAQQYVLLIQDWLNRTPDAALILQAMLRQRVELGLVEPGEWTLSTPVIVRPVVAIGHGFSDEALHRLHVVRQALAVGGLGNPPLQVYDVDLTGALKELS